MWLPMGSMAPNHQSTPQATMHSPPTLLWNICGIFHSDPNMTQYGINMEYSIPAYSTQKVHLQPV